MWWGYNWMNSLIISRNRMHVRLPIDRFLIWVPLCWMYPLWTSSSSAPAASIPGAEITLRRTDGSGFRPSVSNKSSQSPNAMNFVEPRNSYRQSYKVIFLYNTLNFSFSFSYYYWDLFFILCPQFVEMQTFSNLFQT